MDLTKLNEVLEVEPPYRAKQIDVLVYKQLIDDWSQAQGLPVSLRDRMIRDCPLAIDAAVLASEKDDAAKAVVTLRDGLKIETVLMRHEDDSRDDASRPKGSRNTVCVSSQVGCPMGCIFCATGAAGFKRNLTKDEIVEQVLFFARYLKGHGGKVTNIVFMGMGEPFLNYDAVMEAARIINGKMGIGARHISISTVGVTEGIEKLAHEPLQVNLAVSLHAPNDALRATIIPANKIYSIDMIIRTVYGYLKATNRRVMFEYVMIDGVNDSDACAEELAALIKKRLSLKLAFVNLIRYNPTGKFVPSKPEQVKRFREIIESRNIEVTERYRFGRAIKGACGQLANTSN